MKRFEGYEKGVDLGGWLSQCSEYTVEHYRTFIGEEDFAVIAGWGADHVRLPVDWQVFQHEDGSWQGIHEHQGHARCFARSWRCGEHGAAMHGKGVHNIGKGIADGHWHEENIAQAGAQEKRQVCSCVSAW